MFVRDVMSRRPATASPEHTVGEALRKMNKICANRLPVVSRGSLVGIVTRNDLLRVLGKPESARLPLELLMSRPVVVISSDETLERAASRMLDNKVSGLPVVDDGRLVGIVTRSDLLLALAKMLGYGNTGARVAIELEDVRIIDELALRLGSWNLESLVTLHDPATRRWSVVARVRGRRGLLKFQPSRARLPVQPSAQ